jgi:hypothetical protein
MPRHGDNHPHLRSFRMIKSWATQEETGSRSRRRPAAAAVQAAILGNLNRPAAEVAAKNPRERGRGGVGQPMPFTIGRRGRSRVEQAAGYAQISAGQHNGGTSRKYHFMRAMVLASTLTDGARGSAL